MTATNAFGENFQSPAGNGATIVTIPDSPVNLMDNKAITTDSVIGITWIKGISTGGQPIIDYRILYDQSIGTYVVLAQNIVTTSYQT